jgi:glycosyltransferase involved in cell wall biosynthesis
MRQPPELSVVIPCLNEGATLRLCVHAAQNALAKYGIAGEVIVADNGSSDDSVAIAKSAGARIVHVGEKGYGSALRGGIEVACGRFVLMGDADLSYDFGEIPRFLRKLREGYDLVLGNRFAGGIRPRAMPWHHRFIGNPLLTRCLNLFYRTSVGDAHCGMRALARHAFRRIEFQTTGMEFASEMVIKASLARLKIAEVPVSYRPDGRQRPPHLKSFPDGWRHLRFLLIYSPRWLFAVPGLFLFGAGLALIAMLYSGPLHIERVEIDVHVMVLGALMALLGFQILCFGASASVLALSESHERREGSFETVLKYFTLERGIIAGALITVLGFAFLVRLTSLWVHVHFGPLELDQTLRPAIAGMLLVALGVQTVFASFLLSLMALRRR